MIDALSKIVYPKQVLATGEFSTTPNKPIQR